MNTSTVVRRAPASAAGSPQGSALAVGGLALAVLALAASTAILDWDVQAVLLTALVPGLLMLYDYRLGLALLILILPFDNAQFLPKIGSLSALNVLILGVVLSFLLRAAMRQLTPRSLQVLAPRTLVLFYFVPVTIAVIVGSRHFKEMSAVFLVLAHPDGYTIANYWVTDYFKRMLLVAAACVLASAVFDARGGGRKWVVLFVVAALTFVVAQILLTASSGLSAAALQASRKFFLYLGRQNNEAGLMLVTAFGPVLFMREMVRRPLGRIALTVAALALIGAILLTGSRGAFVGMACVVGVYLLHFRRLRTAVFVVMVALIGVAVAPDAVQERLLRGIENKRIESVSSRGDELTAGRVYVWEHLAAEIPRSPLYGRGLLSTQWSEFVRTGGFAARHPHNVYLEILMDMGVYGAICMFVFYRWVWRMFRRLGRDERFDADLRGFFLGAAAGLVGMLVAGIAHGHYFPAPEQAFFWIAVGLAIGYSRIAETLPAPAPVEAAQPRRGARRTRPAQRLEPVLLAPRR